MEKELTLLIDIDSIIYYETYKENLFDAIQGIDNRMKRIFLENDTTKYIAFLTEGKCFRYNKAFSKEYKSNRIQTKPKWFYVLREYLKSQYNAISIDGLEADDCVAFFSNKMLNSRICSPDKDVLYQCVGVHYNYQLVAKKDNNGNKIKNVFHSKGFVTTNKETAMQFLFTQIIMGDATDGISGIEGIGVKTATKWLLDWEETKNDGITVIEHILYEYIRKYGQVDGISKFAETFKLVYLLKTDSDMLREIKYIPKIPEIQTFVEKDKDMEENIKW